MIPEYSERALDALQMGLGVLGMLPGAGNVFDLANAGISVARGNYDDATFNLAAAAPVTGLVVGGAVIAKTAIRWMKAGRKVKKAVGAYKAVKSGPSNFELFKGFSRQLRDAGVGQAQRKIILRNIRDNFSDYSQVKISRIRRERSFWRRWEGNADELGRYGSIGPRSANYSRNNLAVLEDWNTLQNKTRFRIRRGGLVIEGPTAPKVEPSGLVRPGGGWQLYVPNLDDLFIP